MHRRDSPAGGTTHATPVRPIAIGLHRGAEIGRYAVLRELGRGGMGRVYLARDRTLGRDVALKTLLHLDPDDLDAGQRIAREAQALAQVRHPNVVQVYDVGVVEGTLCMALEYVRGETLHAWLSRPRPLHAIVSAFEQAAQGLAAVHDAGFVHRDFKPSNALIDSAGIVRVLDFGLVRLLSAPCRSERGAVTCSLSFEVDLTLSGTVLGTPSYMAPEQHRGEAVDGRADQYALCVALFEALYGHHPFLRSADDVAALVRAKHDGSVWRSLRRRRARSRWVPRALARVIRRGLAPDPAARFDSMTQLAEALRPWTQPRRTPRRLLLVGAAAAAVALAWIDGLPLVREVQARDCGDERCGSTEATVAGTSAMRESLAQIRVAIRTRRLDHALAQLERLREAATAAGATAIVAETWMSTGDVARLQGEYEAAATAYERSYLDALSVRGAGLERIAARGLIAHIEMVGSRMAQPTAALRRVPEVTALLAAVDDPVLHATLHTTVGMVLNNDDRFAEAIASLELARERVESVTPVDREELYIVHNALGRSHFMLGHAEAALAHTQLAADLATEVHGPRHPAVAKMMGNIGMLHATIGDAVRARTAYAESIAATEGALGPEHPSLAPALGGMGVLASSEGDHEVAIAYHDRVIAIHTRQGPAGAVALARALGNRAVDLAALGQLDRAEADAVRALGMIEDQLGHDHTLIATLAASLGRIHRQQGRLQLALAHAERAAAVADATWVEPNDEAASIWVDRAVVLRELGLLEAARDSAEHALTRQEQREDRENPMAAQAFAERGRARIGLGQTDDGIADLSHALALMRRRAHAPEALARLRFDLARVVWAADRGLALTHARDALADLTGRTTPAARALQQQLAGFVEDTERARPVRRSGPGGA